MLSDGVSEHQILKIFLGGGLPPDPPRWAADEAVAAAFGGASAPPTPKLLQELASTYTSSAILSSEY